MNFLQLVQRAAVECGTYPTQAVATAIPSIASATGSGGRLVNWVNDGWTDLQMDRDDWTWMRSSYLLNAGSVFATVAGQASYPLGVGVGTVGVAADAFGKWDRGSFRTFTTAAGTGDETPLGDISFDAWRDTYMFGANRTVRTRPDVAAIGPDNSICLGPPSDGTYTVEADYFRAPLEMAADGDVPTGLPVQFHMLIVYRAMMKYAGYEAATEVYQRALKENAGMYAQLLLLRAPRFEFAGALA